MGEREIERETRVGERERKRDVVKESEMEKKGATKGVKKLKSKRIKILMGDRNVNVVPKFIWGTEMDQFLQILCTFYW